MCPGSNRDANIRLAIVNAFAKTKKKSAHIDHTSKNPLDVRDASYNTDPRAKENPRARVSIGIPSLPTCLKTNEMRFLVENLKLVVKADHLQKVWFAHATLLDVMAISSSVMFLCPMECRAIVKHTCELTITDL